MPRDASGNYTLPLGNPVVTNTIVESAWANSTMSDVAQQLNGVVTRDGKLGMQAPLTLAGTPVNANHAVSKSYVDQFMAYSSGMPIGTIFSYSGTAAPSGCVLCNGQAINRVTYEDLFLIIGTTYGAGDGATTFNVPDMRGEFIRGRPDGRAMGNKQAASYASHVHAVSDPTHSHYSSFDSGLETVNHSHSGHTLTAASAGNHNHTYTSGGQKTNSFDSGTFVAGVTTTNTSDAGAHTHGISGQTDIQSAGHRHSVTGPTNAVATGITLGASGGTETVPQNIALDYYIKAAQDGSGSGTTLVGVSSSDHDMIDIDNTNPVVPLLDIKSNVPFGIPKLDASGKVGLANLPAFGTEFMGYYDASGGALPSGSFASGSYYAISVSGTLTVYDPVTLLAAPTVVTVASQIHYVAGSVTNPTGWYYVVNTGTVLATDVQVIPSGTIGATNVQAALEELDTDIQGKATAADLATKVSKTGNESISGTKTFTDVIAGSVNGASGRINNGNGEINVTNPDWGCISRPNVNGAQNSIFLFTDASGDVKAKIDTSGNLSTGVDLTTNQNISGAKTFSHPLSVEGSNLQIKRLNSATQAQYIGFYNDGSMTLDGYLGYGGVGKNMTLSNSAGSIDINTSALSCSGTISTAGNLAAFSDERIKTNWRGFGPGFVEALACIKSGIYDRTDVEMTQVGVSAQSLQTLMPDAVLEAEDGRLSVAYGNAALVACIELAKRVVELERRLQLLEG